MDRGLIDFIEREISRLERDLNNINNINNAKKNVIEYHLCKLKSEKQGFIDKLLKRLNASEKEDRR